MSRIFLVTDGYTIPALVLEENGVLLPGLSIELLGAGALGHSRGTFWKLTPVAAPAGPGTPLLPSSSYLLKAIDGGVESTLTQFTTAAGYAKQPGQAPVLTELRLWRVHYPADQIMSGMCVWSEYMSYVDLNYQDGSVPGTPPEEVIGVISLSSRKDLGVSTFVFAGGHFEGAPLWDGATQSVVDVPEDGVPDPALALWMPTLAPDAEYCATMTLHGREDQGVPGITSNPICAKVRNVEAPSRGGGSGCSFHGRPTGSAWASALLALFGWLLMRRRPR